jgi:hypothetical protein
MTAGAPDSDVTAEQLASWLAISTSAVRDAAQRGVIERAGRGCYRLKGSVGRYCAHLRRLVVERTEGPAAAARARLLAEQTRNT